MHIEHVGDQQNRLVRRYEYEDDDVIVVDLGADRDATVDVVDGSAIVVVERDGSDPEQLEIDLPDGDAQAFIRNGVLTIEVNT